jgi:Putative Flp pilus-assembly TadE/G-like
MANFAGAPRRRNGSATVWLAISLVAIVGILALGMDCGRMMEERRHAQGAADAAALAGAKQGYDQQHQYPSRAPSSGNIIQAANVSLTDAGYVNNGISATLAVNVPPTSGQFKGNASYVEVIVESKVKATFGRIFTQTDPVVRARSVANFQRNPQGLVVLDPSAAGALNVSGFVTLKVVQEAVHVNSNNPLAVLIALTASLVADVLDILGGLLGILGALLGTPTANVPPVPDPLASLPPPNLASYPVVSGSLLTCSSSQTLVPGIYTGGINVTGGSITFNPGVYILNGGGLTVSGNSNIVANGVLLYNTGAAAGPISVTGPATFSLSAPSTGPYAYIAIFQDRIANQPLKFNATGNLNISGFVYAAAAPITVTGNGVANGTMLGWTVSNTLHAKGSGTILVGQSLDPPPTYKIRLVE